jgi:hypothetical protein
MCSEMTNIGNGLPWVQQVARPRAPIRGTELGCATAVTPIPAPLAHARPLVHRHVERGQGPLTCEVWTDAPRADDPVVFRHSTEHRRAVERFDGPRGAFIRHATMASGLRDTGWRLIRLSR